MTDEPTYSRRRLLASAGVVGAVGLGAARRGGSSAGPGRAYTNVTYAATDGPDVRVAWYGTYNGELLSASPTAGGEWAHDEPDEYVDDVADRLDGPVVEVPNLLPGDSGTVSIGLLVEERDDAAPASVWVRRRLAEGTNALAERVDLSLWYDVGLFGVGGCRGAEAGTFGRPVVEGTLAAPQAVPDAGGDLATGLPIDPGFFTDRCLAPGERLCLGFAWAVGEDVGNEYQGTDAVFDLEFRAVSCGTDAPVGNPFAGDDGTAPAGDPAADGTATGDAGGQR